LLLVVLLDGGSELCVGGLAFLCLPADDSGLSCTAVPLDEQVDRAIREVGPVCVLDDDERVVGGHHVVVGTRFVDTDAVEVVVEGDIAGGDQRADDRKQRDDDRDERECAPVETAGVFRHLPSGDSEQLSGFHFPAVRSPDR
jgi:hypothetical protein